MRSLLRSVVAESRAAGLSRAELGLDGYYAVSVAVLGGYATEGVAGVAGDVAQGLVETLVVLGVDDATETYVRGCMSSRLGYAVKDIAHSVLTCCMSATNASALLGKCDMWVFSASQMARLLAAAEANAAARPHGSLPALAHRPIRKQALGWDHLATLPRPAFDDDAAGGPSAAAGFHAGTLLDVGAGTGSVTEQLAPFVDTVVATETAIVNVWCLRSRGFAAVTSGVLEEAGLAEALVSAGAAAPRRGEPLHFDVVSCFNVLDRCDTPQTLLDDMVALVEPESGRLILSIVLPYHPSVEVGSRWERPSQFVQAPLGDDAPFEAWVVWFTATFLHPAGLRVLSWSRVPYISPGNTRHAFFVLYNALFVCERI
ncbi:DORA reverse strand protein 1 [Thecamonas trahens ATCC 50062]|uniref:DORA reverse strand protein 1 n=1 Tax=Thecamonas trahens ATCC 50062 TaxID=461836 RepID=A0A0L0D5M2_THETB|nr:DORA reverse strand protein 1 [Thecamonas trahens ATCC 50062]KNC46598.1 DORA reverse strand protein 1 [Thecamonas trahens ATCC 50062]|eukprot:XP_013760373.1 DORA reverse strand protein 1 [Thecamonas trahens ATCC 50062]